MCKGMRNLAEPMEVRGKIRQGWHREKVIQNKRTSLRLIVESFNRRSVC